MKTLGRPVVFCTAAMAAALGGFMHWTAAAGKLQASALHPLTPQAGVSAEAASVPSTKALPRRASGRSAGLTVPAEGGELGFVIREWFALGSGCRALPGAPGDVELVREGSLPGPGERHRIRFSLPNYALRGDQPVVADKPSFARQCGLRMAIYPAANKRLAGLSVRTGFTVEKAGAGRLQLKARLLLGDRTLADMAREYGPDEQVRSSHPVVLDADSGGDAFTRLTCGQPKIVGIDVMALTLREDARDGAEVSLEGHTLTLDVRLADCPDNQARAQPEAQHVSVTHGQEGSSR